MNHYDPPAKPALYRVSVGKITQQENIEKSFCKKYNVYRAHINMVPSSDNPFLESILHCRKTCWQKLKYSGMHDNEQLFASKYTLYLPTGDDLRAEIEAQKAMLYLQQQDKEKPKE